MTFCWISDFSSLAQLKCFRIESGNFTTRLSIFGVLACLNKTLLSHRHVSVIFGLCTGRATVKGSYHFRLQPRRTYTSHFRTLSSGVCVHSLAIGRHHFVVILLMVYLLLPG